MNFKIIINADDFGLSPHVNASIIRFIDQRLISSTTVMANAPAFEQAAHYAQSCSGISFGVHLNLTEFKSLSQPAIFADLGLMTADNYCTHFVHRMTPPLFQAVVAEWSLQIQRCLDHGIRVSHLDGHHHVHTRPQLFGALKAVQKKFGIRKVRNTYNLGGKFSFSKSCRKQLWSWALKNYYSTTTTDYFLSYQEFLELPHRPSSSKTVELMCHPGGVYGAEDTLMLDRALAARLPFDLITYHDL